MSYSINITEYTPSPLNSLGEDFSGRSARGETLSFNNYFPEKNGRPFFAVSGEFHYSRMDERRWERELIKMRMGGINIVSTYLFWNHIEEEEGIFDFSGNRNLRKFIRLCAKHELYVILRVGPFDHGEVRNGGLPDWLYGKPFEVRTTDEGFLRYVRRLYTRIGEEIHGLFHQDNGPIIGVQLDNEYMHSSAPWEMTTGISNEWVFGGNEGETYLLKLRELALESGLTPAFFTGTAWGGAAYSPRILPLWGGYAYRPWIFLSYRGEHPATEEYLYEDYHHDDAVCADDFKPAYRPSERPYACCEMGAGMMCCYHYRFIFPCKSVDAMTNIKVASGCNFIGYYMYHGGTNPLGKHGQYLNECQVPKRSYDYQAALGEFGQIRESYSRLKSIHFFTRCFGERLAPMETILPEGATQIHPEDMETLRFAVRTDGKSGFLFLNNFQDHRVMPPRAHEQVKIVLPEETLLFDVSLATDENAILPFNFEMEGIQLKQATAQPVLRTVIRDRATYVFLIPDGMDPAFRFEEGAETEGNGDFFTVRKEGKEADVLVISREMANQLFLLRDGSLIFTDAALLEDEKGGLKAESTRPDLTLYSYPADRLAGVGERLENTGVLGKRRIQVPAVTIRTEVASSAPYRWRIVLPDGIPESLTDARLQIDYRGDIGMLFLQDVMIHDHFCNGDIWEIGLMEHRDQLRSPLVLKITPIREGARVNVESAMAARKEEVLSASAELKSVRIQPVYDIPLS